MPIVIYTVQPGDTIYGIARRYGVTPQSIISSNHLVNPDLIQPGQKLQINVPGTGLQPAPPATPAPIFRGDPNRARIALTFDATFGDNFTNQILTILEQYGVMATWFISGIWAENFPDLLRAINAAGHEIGNHSQMHPHMTELSSAEMRQQILQAGEAIQNVIDRPVNLFRPPFGEYDQTLLKVAAELGCRTIMWTIDSLDWQDPGPEYIVERVLGSLEKGAIILMHNAAADTPEALPTLLDETIRRGYAPVTVSEII